jgi:putative cardiolipin synthase
MRPRNKKPGWAAAAGILAVTALGLAGCRSLPQDFEPGEPGFAFDPASEGPLAEMSLAFEEQAGDHSGFLLLDRNDESLWWRLAVIDSATESLDLQTYLWARDFSGQLIAARMQRAADRGVRVRVLVDDFLTRGRDRSMAALDQHPNIEIRVWNPGRQRRLGRNLEYLVRLRELNHRLHNKVLIADNRVVISGGRNIADAYFGLSSSYNFWDLDLLAVGPVVPPTSAMFDRYWNSPQAVPGRIFHRRASENDIPAVTKRRRSAMEASSLSDIVPIDPQDWSERLGQAVDKLIPGDAEVIYDKPGELQPSQHALVGLQRFMREAQREVLAANAYLVPGEPFFEEAARLEAKGVHMAIITNSLGSTNQTIVHHAYARSRMPMMAAGVDVFEMKYHPAMQRVLDMACIHRLVQLQPALEEPQHRDGHPGAQPCVRRAGRRGDGRDHGAGKRLAGRTQRRRRDALGVRGREADGPALPELLAPDPERPLRAAAGRAAPVEDCAAVLHGRAS